MRWSPPARPGCRSSPAQVPIRSAQSCADHAQYGRLAPAHRVSTEGGRVPAEPALIPGIRVPVQGGPGVVQRLSQPPDHAPRRQARIAVAAPEQFQPSARSPSSSVTESCPRRG